MESDDEKAQRRFKLHRTGTNIGHPDEKAKRVKAFTDAGITDPSATMRQMLDMENTAVHKPHRPLDATDPQMYGRFMRVRHERHLGKPNMRPLKFGEIPVFGAPFWHSVAPDASTVPDYDPADPEGSNDRLKALREDMHIQRNPSFAKIQAIVANHARTNPNRHPMYSKNLAFIPYESGGVTTKRFLGPLQRDLPPWSIPKEALPEEERDKGPKELKPVNQLQYQKLVNRTFAPAHMVDNFLYPIMGHHDDDARAAITADHPPERRVFVGSGAGDHRAGETAEGDRLSPVDPDLEDWPYAIGEAWAARNVEAMVAVPNDQNFTKEIKARLRQAKTNYGDTDRSIHFSWPSPDMFKDPKVQPPWESVRADTASYAKTESNLPLFERQRRNFRKWIREGRDDSTKSGGRSLGEAAQFLKLNLKPEFHSEIPRFVADWQDMINDKRYDRVFLTEKVGTLNAKIDQLRGDAKSRDEYEEAVQELKRVKADLKLARYTPAPTPDELILARYNYEVPEMFEKAMGPDHPARRQLKMMTGQFEPSPSHMRPIAHRPSSVHSAPAGGAMGPPPPRPPSASSQPQKRHKADSPHSIDHAASPMPDAQAPSPQPSDRGASRASNGSNVSVGHFLKDSTPPPPPGARNSDGVELVLGGLDPLAPGAAAGPAAPLQMVLNPWDQSGNQRPGLLSAPAAAAGVVSGAPGAPAAAAAAPPPPPPPQRVGAFQPVGAAAAAAAQAHIGVPARPASVNSSFNDDIPLAPQVFARKARLADEEVVRIRAAAAAAAAGPAAVVPERSASAVARSASATRLMESVLPGGIAVGPRLDTSRDFAIAHRAAKNTGAPMPAAAAAAAAVAARAREIDAIRAARAAAEARARAMKDDDSEDGGTDA